MLGITCLELLVLLWSGQTTFFSYLLTFAHIGVQGSFLYALLKMKKKLVSNTNYSTIVAIIAIKAVSFTLLFYIMFFVTDQQGSLIPTDALLIHIPQILAITDYMIEGTPLPELSAFGTYYLSNYYFSVLNILLFQNLYLSVMVGLMILMALNVFLINFNCKAYFQDVEAGRLSLIIIFFAQSFFFYSLQLYKEGFFYLLVNLLIYCIIKRRVLLVIFFIFLIFHERFYAAIIMSSSGIIVGILHGGSSLRSCLLFGSLLFISLVTFLHSGPIDIWRVIEIMNQFRSGHAMSDAGTSIPFPFTVIQVFLTPIPNMYKLEHWIYQDRLLIGSFIFSFALAISFSKLILKRNNWFLAWCLYTFFGYVLLWSWIAPFNGRARDGIFPILVIIILSGIFNLKSALEHGKK
jgi:hypothetical protein